MTSTYERIKSDIKRAMKSGEKEVLGVLRIIDSEIQRKSLDTKAPILEDLIIGVLDKGVKQRDESIEQFRVGKREDLVKKEQVERAIYKEYLPTPLSEEEIKVIVDRAVGQVKAQNPELEDKKVFGLVMKIVMPEVRGKSDGKLVNKIVLEILG